MPTDNQIRDLCLRVCNAGDPEEFNVALAKLKAVLFDSIIAAENYATMLTLLENLKPVTTEQFQDAVKKLREQAALEKAAS